MRNADICFIGAGFHAAANTYPSVIEAGVNIKAISTWHIESTPFCRNEENFIKLACIHIVDLMKFLYGEVKEVSSFRNNTGENITDF